METECELVPGTKLELFNKYIRKNLKEVKIKLHVTSLVYLATDSV